MLSKAEIVDATLSAAIEERDLLEGQGWTRDDFAAQLGVLLAGTKRTALAASCTKEGMMSVGKAVFAPTEAAHIVALAADPTAAPPANPATATDNAGVRWLLWRTGGVLHLNHEAFHFRLRAEQVQQAHRLASQPFPSHG